jgi:heme/copper-type cytochrome/quinol oxidase subunit 1
MYMVGLSHTTRMLFSTLTVMISVPAATKLMHWCVTIVNSVFVMELPFLFTFTFVYFFVSGGVSGMYVANTGMDILFHDTFYVIGHFHVMFAGSAMIGLFSAFYFYFPAIYGVKYSRIYGYIHYVYYILGQIITVVPMLWLGYCGHPRRVLDYPAVFGGWHSISSAGHLLSVMALLSFFFMIYDSIRQAKPTIRNNFGVSRFNTRLNFYFFEINRLSFLQRKLFFNLRLQNTNTHTNNTALNQLDIVSLETTLFSYQFFK